MLNSLITLTVALTLAAGPVGPYQGQPPRQLHPIDFIPPEWTQFNIIWKPTWDETHKANPEAVWHKEIRGNKALAHAAASILQLRRIALYQALMTRFPAEKAKHAAAYYQIASTYHGIGMHNRRSYWCWKLLKDFPKETDLHEQARRLMISWSMGNPARHPDGRAWRFAVDEVLSLHKSGRLPDNSPAVNQALSCVQQMLIEADRFDLFAPHMKQMEAMAARYPAHFRYLAGMVQSYGHYVQSGQYTQKADNANVFNPPANVPVGEVYGFPRNMELDTRWEALVRGQKLADRKRPVDPEQVQAIYDLWLKTGACLARGKSHYVPFGQTVTETLLKLPPSRLGALRDAQDKAARYLARAAKLMPDRNGLSHAMSRYPFAKCLHEVAIETAERDLRQGRCEWAMAALQDVVRLAAEPELRLQAQAALWLAMVQAGRDHAAIQAAMARVPDGAKMPWRGQTVTAGQLKRVLLARMPAAAGPASIKLSQLPRRTLQLPTTWPRRERNMDGPVLDYGVHAPWPVRRVRTTAVSTFVECPTRLARFDAGKAEPVWNCRQGRWPPAESAPWHETNSRRTLSNLWYMQFDRRPVRTSRLPVSAAPADNRPLQALLTGQAPPAVAALDPKTGKTLWSTAGRTEWQALEPLSDPAASDQCVYVLAGPAEPGQNAGLGPGRAMGPAVPQYLVCLDTNDGRMLWKRDLGWQPHTLLDLARGSAAIALHEGAVYCGTNMGIVARCSAGDGRLQWVRGYASAIQPHIPHSLNFSREGASPLIIGNNLYLAPRDHSGILAMRCDTGELLWEAIMVPSDKLVGVSGNVVVGVNQRYLTALAVTTGKQLWCRRFPEGTGSQAAVIGPDVVLVSGGKALRISAATGKTVEEMPLPLKGGAEAAIGPDGTLVEIVPPSLSPGKPVAPAAATPLRLPLKEVWTLPCENPVAAFPEDGRPTADAFCILAGRRLACVRTRPAWEVLWEKRLTDRPQVVSLLGNRILLGTSQDVTSLEAATGKQQWSLRLPFVPYELRGDGKLICATTFPHWSPYAGAIDAATGKLLWARSFSQRSRFNGGFWGSAFKREGNAATLGVCINTLYGDVSWRCSDVTMDARTGRIQTISKVQLEKIGWWGRPAYGPDGLNFMGSDARPHSVTRTGRADRAAVWQHKIDWGIVSRNHAKAGVDSTPAGLYFRSLGELAHFDPATKKETVYALPYDPALFPPHVLAYHRVADMLMVVSGTAGQLMSGGRGYDVRQSSVSVDLFHHATGKHLEHQPLPGVLCYQGNLTGLDTRARILDDAIVVTDAAGVHVFAAWKPTDK